MKQSCAFTFLAWGLLKATASDVIILDDMDSSAVEMHNAHEGSFHPCQTDAYHGQFHHDWARNKGDAHMVFKFDPPSNGCYKIEEHHPGSDAGCQRYMPTNTRLDVEYCMGLTATHVVNQAVNGGLWNELGHYKFFHGHEGRFTLSNSEQETCAGSGAGEGCFWVADAFRVTLISPDVGHAACSHHGPAPAPAPPQHVVAGAHVAPPMPQATVSDVIIMDDMDSSAVERHNAHEGSFAPCQVDAYNGQFHHDWARNKGDAHMVFKFDPPSNGCYKIEERHPGSDAACQRYMPTNTRLDVEYCMGLTATHVVNQAVNGGLWNEVGHYKFFHGHEGRFTLSNSEQETCAGSGSGEGCFWVADAFRATLISPDVGHAACSGHDPAESRAPYAPHRSGALSLVLRVASGANGDLGEVLSENRGAVASALATHLGYTRTALQISAIELRSARRLQAGSTTVEVSFRTFAEQTLAPSAQSLKELLQSAFDANDANLVVESATVAWHGGVAEPSSSDFAMRIISIIMGVVVCSCGVYSMIAVVCCLLKRRLRKAEQKEELNMTPKELEGVTEEVDKCEEAGIEKDKNEKVDDADERASTATPTSDTRVDDIEEASTGGDSGTATADIVVTV